ncbi:MAG: hypothetical protein CBB97_00420 [Candidatus Endolissoclinum sp. TMED37]|nr:MAG: hypothetical protein CBB97_00420 [Candidatus Endolissoclinum sp. TMED37]|tara:strand:- start:1234 stop:1533 length:300 start_codon:yes stop_codon:yes gene_type:complete
MNCETSELSKAIIIKPLVFRDLEDKKFGVILEDNIRFQADINEWLHLLKVFVEGKVEVFCRPILDKSTYEGISPGGVTWSNHSRLNPLSLDYFIEYLDD